MPILLAGAVFALCVAPITEGERVVPPVVALHGRFLCTNLGRRSISKGNMATPQLKPCQGLRCVVAMLASELLPLPAFKLSRLSCEVAMFVCQVPQLSGFKL